MSVLACGVIDSSSLMTFALAGLAAIGAVFAGVVSLVWVMLRI